MRIHNLPKSKSSILRSSIRMDHQSVHPTDTDVNARITLEYISDLVSANTCLAERISPSSVSTVDPVESNL